MRHYPKYTAPNTSQQLSRAKAHECVAAGSTRSTKGGINKIPGRCATAFIVGDPLFYNIFCRPPPPFPSPDIFVLRRRSESRAAASCRPFLVTKRPTTPLSKYTPNQPTRARAGVTADRANLPPSGVALDADNQLAVSSCQLEPLRRAKRTDAVAPSSNLGVCRSALSCA